MGEQAGYNLESYDRSQRRLSSSSFVVVVEDNTASEALLHQFFADLMVTDDRELLVAGNIDSMVNEAQKLTDASLLSEIAEEALSETLLEQAALAAAIAPFMKGQPENATQWANKSTDYHQPNRRFLLSTTR